MFARISATSAALAILVLASACAPSAPAVQQKSAANAAAPHAGDFVPGELLIRWKSTAAPATIAAANATQGATLVRQSTGVKNLQHIRVPVGNEVAVAAALRANPNVLYAEPNYRVSIAVEPDDPFYAGGDLWGLNNVGQNGGTTDADINAPESWDQTTGSPATVIAVIDTGVDYTHPDLAANMWINPIEAAGTPGVDDDVNGYIDDIHGIDTVNGDSDPMDDQSHGTHCAGTIGAVGDDGAGVVGVNWDVQIIACKFLDAGGSGSFAGAVECLDYLRDLKLDGTADVVASSNSWRDYVFSQALEDAIGANAAADILFIAAAGNETIDNDTVVINPANSFHPNVITVAATDRNDQLAGFSNYGRRRVHVGAPGVEILSTVPVAFGSYAVFDGTSMAAPHVSGLVGLLKSQDPLRTFSEIKNLVLAGAQPIASLDGFTVTGARIRGFDSVNQGSLNCTTNTARSRLLPIEDSLDVPIGTPIDIHAIDVVCDLPAAPSVEVDVNGGAGSITLLDDGIAPDDFAGDGRYAGTYTAACGASLLTFPWGETLTVTGDVGAGAAYLPGTLVGYAPRTLVAPTAVALLDDSFETIAPGMPIRYGGNLYTSINIVSNGNVQFTSSSVDFVNSALPVAVGVGYGQPIEEMVAVFWDDFNLEDGGIVQWEVQGTAPNRELVVEWNGVPHFGFGGAYTFQLVLSEGTDDVLFNYVDVTSGAAPDLGAGATIGVQISPSSASQFSFNAASVADATSVLFTLAPPDPNAPVVAPLTTVPGPVDEGSTLLFSSSFTDLDGDGPFTAAWDDDGDGSSDFVEVVSAGVLSRMVPFPQDGSFVVSVTVYDQACLQGSSSAAVQIDNVVPVLEPLVAEFPPIYEGIATHFISSFTDPGADAQWVMLWDFDDDLLADDVGFYGAPGAVASVPVIFPENGTVNVNGVVFEQDGLASPSDLVTTPTVILDVDPVVFTFSATPVASQDEPNATFSFGVDAVSGATDDPSADPLTMFEWDLDGDGSFELSTPFNVGYIEHTYADSGSYTATLRVHDEDSFTSTTVIVVVMNLDPAPAPIGDSTHTEGDTVVIQAMATDPAGIHDPITWSLGSGPAGLSVTPSGVITWTPSYAQSGRDTGTPHPVSVNCADGDGGTCNVSFTLTAVVRDDDGDGMADTWEVENGLDPSVDDSAGDLDGDGVSNLDEYHDANGGPFSPELVAAMTPADDSEVTTVDLELTVQNANDPDSGALTYVFQVSDDEEDFSAPLVEDTESEGGGGTTTITLTVPGDVMLVDDVTYYWRAWARDEGNRNGPFTAPQAFFYNPVNDPPTAPGISAPVIASHVPDLTPDLVAGNSTDVDDASRTYRFRVYSDETLTMMVADSGAVAEGPNGLTSYTVSPPLSDNTLYWWTVLADDGAATTLNDAGEMFVNLANDEPSAPALVGPADGGVLTVTAATLEVTNSQDAEGDPLTYLFELDTAPSFNTVDYLSSGVVVEGASTTTFAVSSLVEDATYYWRARAYDGLSYGDWSQGSFRVNAVNAPPTAPIAASPVDGNLVPDTEPTLSVTNATDIEGDALTYIFTVLDEAGATSMTVSSAIPEGTGQTDFVVPSGVLSAGETYTFTVVATDALGASGPASAPATFAVFKASGGGGGGGGCGCDVSGGGAMPRGVIPAFLLAIAAIVLRRRKVSLPPARAITVASIVALFSLVVAGCASPAASAPKTPEFGARPEPAIAGAPETVPGELLVRWKKNAAPSHVSIANTQIGAAVVRKSTGVPGLEHVRLAPGTEAAALAAYRSHPDVLYAEPNYRSRIFLTPNDPLFGQLWGLENIGQAGGTFDADTNAPEAWDITTGSSATVVGVIDTGIDYTHPDLAANVWMNPGEIPGNGIDDEGNGYIDDIFGIDAINDDSDPFDDHSHGTHVSGTIAADGDNGTDVVGVNWAAQIVSCKAFDDTGNGDTASEVECLDYMLILKTLGLADVVVTNNSWGDVGAQALKDVIAAHAAADILLVAAAGNSSDDNDTLVGLDFPFPANSFEPNVVAVAATDRFDDMAVFSSFGRRTVHLGAPGVDVLSTVPLFFGVGSVFEFSGTSMASPHVAGVAALLASQDPLLEFWQIKNLLMAGARPIGAMDGTTITGGALRAFDASGGSLNCTSSIAQSRVRPLGGEFLEAPAGSLLDVHAIDVVCDQPAGATVLVDVNFGSSTFTLLDDGASPDDFAGDGRFGGTYLVPVGTSVLRFPWGERLQIEGQGSSGQGWTFFNSSPAVGWDVDSTPTTIAGGPIASSAPLSLNYNNGVDYDSGASSGSAVSPPIDLSATTAPTLTFWCNYQTEDPGTVFDQRFVVVHDGVTGFIVDQLSSNGTPLGGACAAMGTPHTHGYTLDSSWGMVVVELYFDTGDGLFNSFAGWAVDDVSFDDGANLALFDFPALPGADPVVAAITLPPGPVPEGTTINVATSFTDPDFGPWMAEWDFDYDGVVFTPDDIQPYAANGAIDTDVLLAQDAPVVTVAVRVHDSVGRYSTTEIATIEVTNVDPILAPITIDAPPVVEGNGATFSSSFTDPGTDGDWAFLWDFDGDFTVEDFQLLPAPGGVTSAPAIYPEQGATIVNAQVIEQEGLGAPSNLQTLPITILDAEPIVNSFVSTPAIAVDEPATFSFDLDAVSGALDEPSFDPIVMIEWDLDDDGTYELSTPEDVTYLEHTYPDNGTFIARVRITDEDGSVEATVSVTVNNVAPVAVAIPDGTITEGQTVAIQAVATDPGGIYDPITWSLDSGPAGLAITPSGVITWTPSYAQSGQGLGTPHMVAIACNDGDGGICNDAFVLNVVVRDDDGDGMADTWEIANGLDPNVNDAAGDIDGDGISNVDEYHNDNGGPFTPESVTAMTPADDAEVTDEDPTLTVLNAIDIDSGALTYVFQISATEAFDTVLAQGSSAEGAVSTSITFDEQTNDDAGNPNDVTLTDNTLYWWRAWARDEGPRNGPWTAPQGFFYSPVNDPPSMPGLSAPPIASHVADTTPTLVAGNSTDPDDPTLTYRFRVFSDQALSTMVADSGVVAEDPSGLTSYTVSPALIDDTRYWWSVTANDGTTTTANATGELFVNLGNDEPTTPAIIAPLDGSQITAASTTLEVSTSQDAEGATLTYLFEIDSSPSFNSADYVSSGQLAATTFGVSGLTEDATYWWRARASDGLASGDFVIGSFTVDAVNAAPTAPVAASPSDDLIVPDTEPTLRVTNSSDTEGDILTYVFTVLDEDAVAVFTSPAVPEGSGSTSVVIPPDTLSKGDTYTWTCVATDDDGASSAPSAIASFSVYKKKSGGGGGGGCSVAGVTATSSGVAGMLGALALVLSLRRRTR